MRIIATSIFFVRPDIPVVLCTGYSESMTRERALELGIRHYLLKPFTVGELTTAVAELIEGAGVGAARTAAPA